ncbi:hypothetical protein SuNHUV7_04960 (plasmid) [Pseudoseohaeicola sp. NH-UV-7]
MFQPRTAAKRVTADTHKNSVNDCIEPEAVLWKIPANCLPCSSTMRNSEALQKKRRPIRSTFEIFVKQTGYPVVGTQPSVTGS